MNEPIGITIEQAMEMKKDCQRKIDIADALTRLHDNPDFKLVFLDEYIESESTRLVNLLGDVSINNGDKKVVYREDIQERMIGIARFSEYIRNAYVLANIARKSIDDINEQISNSNVM